MRIRSFFLCSAFLFAGFAASSTPVVPADSVSIEGRRDSTPDMDGKPAPSSLHVRHSGFRTPMGQSYAITLVGRMVTVVANGKTILCNRGISGLTGGALNRHEGKPGPFYLQGDHGPTEYRHIVLTPAR